MQVLALFHRWAGILLCLMFALWFLSGAVMVFVAFPSLPAAERWARSEPIALAQVQVAPAAALLQHPNSTGLRLLQISGRPRYLLEGSGPVVAVDAVSGTVASHLTAPVAAEIAQRFGRSAAVRTEGPVEHDQWTVHQQFDRARPFYRVALADGAGTQLYVSARSGEVLQRTTAGERRWNWVGSVVHWWYYTALRKDWARWDSFVWWLSLAGLALALAGTTLGLQRLIVQRRSARTGLSPFKGWLRWHHLAGLTGGAFLLLSIFSGWLSMDHGRLFSKGEADGTQLQNYRGATLAQTAAAVSLEQLRSLGIATELRFEAVSGRALVVAHGESGGRVVSITDSQPPLAMRQLPEEWLLAAVRNAWPDSRPGEPQATAAADLPVLAEGMPATAMRIALASPANTELFVDRLTGQIITVMDPSRLRYAWFYYVFHTYRYPGLIDHPNLRKTVIFVPLTLGLMLSISGVIVGLRRLGRYWRQAAATIK